MGGAGKQGMKRDEGAVYEDFKGEGGEGRRWRASERSEELTRERLAVQSVYRLFSRRP